jgi:hypothetical protein
MDERGDGVDESLMTMILVGEARARIESTFMFVMSKETWVEVTTTSSF